MVLTNKTCGIQEPFGWNGLYGTLFSIGDLFITMFSPDICLLSAETLAVHLTT